jgi:hypothetical protein
LIFKIGAGKKFDLSLAAPMSCRTGAARNRDHPATSAKTRLLQLRSRQIEHRLHKSTHL